MIIDCHMHTPLCGHAEGEPEEFVLAAASKGIELVTFTCHIPLDTPSFGGPKIRMSRSQLAEYNEKIALAKLAGRRVGVEVLRGIEAEITPDTQVHPIMDDILEEHRFDFVLGSLHHQLHNWRDWIATQGIIEDAEIIHAYFQQLADGAASGRYHSISHPDVIRIYGTIDSASFVPTQYEDVIRAFLQTLVEHNVCMEVNTSGLTKGVYEIHPDPLILQWAKEEGVRLTIGSDAHRPEAVGQHFDHALALLRRIGFREICYFRKGRYRNVPLGSTNRVRNRRAAFARS